MLPAVNPALLVIGYGNTLRQDDGVGPRVAEQIEALQLPGVQTLSCAQLSPEHAEPIARAWAVVFVDAAESARGPVELQPVSPGTSTQLLAHAADPATMLALAREVYGRAPEAWLLLLPAEQFGFGTELSALAEEGVAQAVREIGRLARGAV